MEPKDRARFYLPQDSTGTVTGIARAVVSITSTNASLVSITYPNPLSDPPGHIAADFQLDTSAFAVDSITVPAGQTIKAGVSSPLIFTAHPRGNIDHILALSPNSQTVQITSGADHLSYSNGSITGLTPGTATLTVTARGATSAQATITVTPSRGVSSPRPLILLSCQETLMVLGRRGLDIYCNVQRFCNETKR